MGEIIKLYGELLIRRNKLRGIQYTIFMNRKTQFVKILAYNQYNS